MGPANILSVTSSTTALLPFSLHTPHTHAHIHTVLSSPVETDNYAVNCAYRLARPWGHPARPHRSRIQRERNVPSPPPTPATWDADRPLSPSSDLATRVGWCRAQVSQCPALCADKKKDTAQNECYPVRWANVMLLCGLLTPSHRRTSSTAVSAMTDSGRT